MCSNLNKTRHTKPSVLKRKLFPKGSKQSTEKPKKLSLLLREKLISPVCLRVQKNPKMSFSDSEEDDEQCLYCCHFNKEGWIRCIVS